jgi:hypothetical protein
MAVYYVLGAMLVVWGLGLAVFGLVRPDFPPSGPAGRTLVGVTVLIVVATLTALLLSTSKEHPREEAAAKAAESGATGATGASGATGATSEGTTGGQDQPGKKKGPKKVKPPKDKGQQPSDEGGTPGGQGGGGGAALPGESTQGAGN